MSLEKELFEIKDRIEKLKAEKQEAQGALNSNLKRARDEFNCYSLDELIAYRDELVEENEQLRLKIEKGIEEVKRQLDG
jgi:hypothetical protein